VLTFGKGWDEIQAYIVKSAGELQVQMKADDAYHQFGWTPKFKSFVVGDIEVTNGKKRYVPPTVSTSDMIPWFEQKGDLGAWKEVFNTYAKDGYEAHAFAALSAFGAPLLKYTTNHKGVLLNLKHENSGTGKTTVLRVIN
jgi:uncharacterized protein (DUF927 family)